MKKKTLNENTETTENVVQSNKFDLLSKTVDAVINKDNDGAEEHFNNYAVLKARDIYNKIIENASTDKLEDNDEDEDAPKALSNRDKKKKPLKKMKKDMNEAAKVAGTADEDETDEDDEEDEDTTSVFLKNRDKKKQPLKKMKKDMNEAALAEEAALREFTGDSSPIRLKGDDVFVNGKLVGSIVNDLSDIDAGITFNDATGNYSKEFDTIRELYRFLVDRYKVSGEIPLDDDEE